MVRLDNDWDQVLADFFGGEVYASLRSFLKTEYARGHVYPDMHHIFEALRLTSLADVRAVILGQDPYHRPGQAHGLCFSVREGVKPPPSLENIYKELETDLGIGRPTTGDLTPWAKEGVLLLNTTLTVREGSPMSHTGRGWEAFTDLVIRKVGEKKEPCVFLLWGSHARSKKALIQGRHHLILETVHPSPLSAYNGFFGCRHFSRANAFLKAQGRGEIDWRLQQ